MGRTEWDRGPLGPGAGGECCVATVAAEYFSSGFFFFKVQQRAICGPVFSRIIRPRAPLLYRGGG